MDRKELSDMLLELLTDETGEEYPGFEESTDLRDGLKLDSIDMVSLVLRIENQLKISIGSQEVGEISTVSDLLDLLQGKLASRELPVGVAA